METGVRKPIEEIHDGKIVFISIFDLLSSNFRTVYVLLLQHKIPVRRYELTYDFKQTVE